MKIRCTKNELEVADLIMKNPHKNLIKIYNVDKKKRNNYGKIRNNYRRSYNEIINSQR